MARHLRKGDNVGVISGKYKGETGKILDVLVDKCRVRIEGVGAVKRHLKPGRDPKVPEGGIVERFATVHWSNVLPLDPSDGKPTRVGRKVLEDGSKVRVSARSGEIIAT